MMNAFWPQKEMLLAIEKEMRDVLEALGPPKNHLYGMMHHHMGWVDQQFQPTNGKAGKRARPLLCLLCCQAAGGNWRQALPAAAAIELLHNFSLIHDDIEDASPKRRGRKTLWKIWGVPLAINAGDMLFVLAHLAINRLINRGVDADMVVWAWRRFDETCRKLMEGQHADRHFETRTNVTMDEYVSMIEGKTAAVLSLCAELGALIASADQQTINHHAMFGRHLGLAFQVRDDILGIWGKETLIGKSVTSDIETRKKTLPVLYAIAHNEQLRQLYAQPANRTSLVPRIVELLNQNGARTFAEERVSYYTEIARHHLEAAQPRQPASTALYQLTAKLASRDA